MTVATPFVTSPTTPTAASALSASPPSGRLAVMAAFAMAASIIPIPFLPDRVIIRVRGAIAHDVISRHGLSLTTDARTALSEVDSQHGARALARKAAELITQRLLRRLGPFGAFASIVRAVEVYALGHLLDRYLTQTRRKGPVRIHADEARAVREAIDRSVIRALSPSLRPVGTTLSIGTEDLRDEFTRWIDAAILTGAALPSYLERRLEAAFDDVIAHVRIAGLADG